MDGRDRDLVKKSIQGDKGALAALYQAHGPAIYRLLARLTANRPDAEDLTQETFLAAYRSLGSWRGEGHLTTWLCGIAIRLYRKSVRRVALVSTEPYEEKREEREMGDGENHVYYCSL